MYAVRLCSRCEAIRCRAALWAEADTFGLMDLCESVGVTRQFCKDGKPPSIYDDGLRQLLVPKAAAKHAGMPVDGLSRVDLCDLAHNAEIVQQCASVVQTAKSSSFEISLPPGGLLIVGSVGTHKTHLACARTVDAARRGFTAKLIKWQRFCIEVRSTYQRGSTETERDMLERYAGLDYLAIDDLGIGGLEKSETSAVTRLAYEILDDRYQSCKTTDITTNLLPSELATQFDHRIARRIDEITTTYVMRLEKK